MAQLTVRNLGDDVKARLHEMARLNGESLEQHVRVILRNASLAGPASPEGLGLRMHALFVENPLDGDLPEFKGEPLRPMSVEE